MTHGSLFSGIGGFDLAAEWMGWENVFHCEWNEFGQKILKYYWPNAKSYNNIKETDFTIHRGRIDVLSGGFPCQPYSMAGKRKGKEDDRHLWPEMLRCIKEVQPRWVLGENVFGLINWSGGLVFHEVQADLEAAGYEVWPYVLPACGINAPHRRDRVWFVAHAIDDRHRDNARQSRETDGIPSAIREALQSRHIDRADPRITSDTKGNGDRRELSGLESADGSQRQSEEHGEDNSESGNYGEIWNVTDSERIGSRTLHIDIQKREPISNGIDSDGKGRNDSNTRGQRLKERNFSGLAIEQVFGDRSGDAIGKHWQNFPTESPLCNGDDGVPSRLDGITFSKWRNESIKGGGNAIVPQLAFQIFKTIEQYEILK